MNKIHSILFLSFGFIVRYKSYWLCVYFGNTHSRWRPLPESFENKNSSPSKISFLQKCSCKFSCYSDKSFNYCHQIYSYRNSNTNYKSACTIVFSKCKKSCLYIFFQSPYYKAWFFRVRKSIFLITKHYWKHYRHSLKQLC